MLRKNNDVQYVGFCNCSELEKQLFQSRFQVHLTMELEEHVAAAYLPYISICVRIRLEQS